MYDKIKTDLNGNLGLQNSSDSPQRPELDH